MMRAAVFILLLAITTQTIIMSFEDLGIGDIAVSPLDYEKRITTFTSAYVGTVSVRITIYFNGSATIGIRINNVKVSIYRSGVSKFVEVNLTKNNTLEITVTNCDVGKVVVYGNSTLEILIPAGTENLENNTMARLKIAYFVSIIAPPILIILIRRTRIYSEEVKEEQIVVI